MTLAPLRRRLGPGAARRRQARIARRREELGKRPLPPQEPVDRQADRARRTRIRQRAAEAIRQHFDDPTVAARVIRMLGLPRTVKPKRRSKAKS